MGAPFFHHLHLSYARIGGAGIDLVLIDGMRQLHGDCMWIVPLSHPPARGSGRTSKPRLTPGSEPILSPPYAFLASLKAQ